MATNIVYEPAHKLTVVVTNPAAPDSGDPVRYGIQTGVALLDEGDGGAGTTETVVNFGQFVAELYVDDTSGAGIAVGAPVFYDDTATGDPLTNLNDDGVNGYFFGIALEAVGANATTQIKVLHMPSPGAGSLTDLAITTGKIANGAVTTGKLAADAVDGTKLDDDAVDSEHIAAGAIDAEHFAAASVETAAIKDANVTSAKLEAPLTRYADVALTSAEVKALKATPIELVAAPGADLAIVPEAIAIVVEYGGTNAFTETDDDLSIGYSGGAEIKEIESTGLIDQTNDEWRYITFEHAETFIPEENTAVVITNLDDEIAGNAGADNEIHVRLYYRTVPTDAFIA